MQYTHTLLKQSNAMSWDNHVVPTKVKDPIYNVLEIREKNTSFSCNIKL